MKAAAFVLAVVILLSGGGVGRAARSIQEVESWKDLKESTSGKSMPGLHYYEFQSENGSKVHLIVAKFGKQDWLVRPVVNSAQAATSEAARSCGCEAAVNGGYFNLSDGESASHVFIDGVRVCDPRRNKALTENVKLKPFLESIFDRSELRVVQDKTGEPRLQICNRNAPLASGETLRYSLQAGPRLLPDLTATQEAFLRTEADGKIFDSIGVNKTAARTAVGITVDHDYVMFICVESKRQDEFSSGVTLADLATLMRRLGCSDALNLDGGTSTTMVVKQKDGDYKMVCGRKPETMVKSVLTLYKP